jgi:hypothetical protein
MKCRFVLEAVRLVAESVRFVNEKPGFIAKPLVTAQRYWAKGVVGQRRFW